MMNSQRKINLDEDSRRKILDLVAKLGFGCHPAGGLSIEESIEIAVTIPKQCFAHLRQEGIDHRQSPTLLKALDKEITTLFGGVRNCFRKSPTIEVGKVISAAYQPWSRELFRNSLSENDQRSFLESYFGQSKDNRAPALCTHFNTLAAAIVKTLCGETTAILQRVNTKAFGKHHTLAAVQGSSTIKFFDSSLYRTLERRRSKFEWLDPSNVPLEGFLDGRQTFERIYSRAQISRLGGGADPWALEIVSI
jgi:hypothetical protein